MEQVAFINGNTFYYWSYIILALAALTAMCVYASLYLGKGGKPLALFSSIAISAILGVVLSRLMHWYCYSDAYKDFATAMTNYASGGFGLMGVFAGCALAVLIVRVLRLCDDAPMMLDCMAVAGGFGIAIGRLSALFNTSDRGVVVADSVRFPFSAPITNSVSGLMENRLATFMIQAMLVGAIAIGIVIYMLILKVMKREIPNGDICLIFLLLYGAVQIVCDSTRYDSMFLRSNRFVSLVQILALGALLIPLFWFSIRMVIHVGFRVWQLPIWGVILGGMGLAGYMEYYVQRNGHKAVLAYSVMSASLGVVILLVLFTRWMSLRGGIQKRTRYVPKFKKGRKPLVKAQ